MLHGYPLVKELCGGLQASFDFPFCPLSLLQGLVLSKFVPLSQWHTLGGRLALNIDVAQSSNTNVGVEIVIGHSLDSCLCIPEADLEFLALARCMELSYYHSSEQLLYIYCIWQQ